MKKENKEHIFGKGWKNHPAWLFLVLLIPVFVGFVTWIGERFGGGCMWGVAIGVPLTMTILIEIFEFKKINILIEGIVVLLIYWTVIFKMIANFL